MNKSKPNKRKIFRKTINAVALSLLTLTLSASAQIVYEYNRYRPFFVSGDSMYPFFNKDATRKNLSTGEETKNEDGSWGDYDEANYSYVCDYGLLDEKDGFIDGLERFDIVMAYFDDDYSLSSGEFISSPKIKRLYGLPGESLYFSSIGELYVKEKGMNEYRYIRQNEYIEEDGHLEETTVGAKYATENNPVTLGENEYFLVGDNRRVNRSNDSRFKGPIGRAHNNDERYPSGSSFIKGKIVAITGKASLEVKYNDEGKKVSDSHLIYSSLLFPWAIKEI